MADLVTIAVTAALTQFVGPTAKHLGEQALERAKHVANKAAALLAAVGREPQPVEPKILLPLVQAAGLETDSTLADKWSALLANAADPAQHVAVQPAFIEVLRQLSAQDALVLEKLYRQSDRPLSDSTYDIIMLKQLVATLGLSYNIVSLSVDNLLRLRLCIVPVRHRPDVLSSHSPVASSILTTVFGIQFMLACSSPVK